MSSTIPSVDLHASWLTRVPIAHRGLHDCAEGRPENSLAAVAACCAANLPAELDVRLSRDGEVVVFHDRALGRLTTARGRVDDRTAAELSSLALLGTAERVPLLRDALDVVGGRVPLLIELKAVGAGAALERAVLRTLAGYRGEVAIQSFRRRSLWHLRHEDVPHAVGHLTRGHLLAHAAVRPGFLGCPVRALPARGVQHRRAAGTVVLAWTVRSHEQEAWARRFADNVIFEGYQPAAAMDHRLSAPESAARASR
jgi:glycerophosphoryl diester phosphodiesterase